MTAGCGCQRVGSPCCPHCRGKAENSHVAPLAAAREQVPGQVCTAGGSLRRQAPRPPPLPGAHASFHLAEQTWSSDALSISAPAHGHHRLTVFMLVASWPEVAATARGITPLHCRLKQKEVGGAEGDVSQKLPGRFLLKRRCTGPDHVPPWHRGLGKQTCGSDDQHGHRPLRRGQVRWPQTKSGFT